MTQPLKKLTIHLLKNSKKKSASNTIIRANSTWWGNVAMGPPDIIFGIIEAFQKDTHERKINLGAGTYRDDNGKPFRLPSVIKAEEILYKAGLNHEYAPIGGEHGYTDALAKLALGEDNKVIKEKTNCTVQSISGTGALRLGLEFYTKHCGILREVWIPHLSWGNHIQICNALGLPVKKYRYFDFKTNALDLQGAIDDIRKIPEGAIIILHACAHNPTGVDPKPEEWKQLSDVIKHKKVLPFFDMAYQGFATGDVDNDAAAVRMFVDEGHEIMLAQSLSKNMGLYGERAGALTLLCGDPDTAAKVMSQVKIMIRTLYSNPPIHGARIAHTVLTQPELKAMWLKDVKQMADRIISMRQKLREGVEGAGSKHSWRHITDQIGMFCYTGLKPDQVERLTNEFHIHLTKDGRISLASLCSKDVEYVAECIHKVTA